MDAIKAQIDDVVRVQCRRPFNSTPMAVDSIPFSPPRTYVRPMGVHRTCGELNEIRKIPTRKNYQAPDAAHP